MKYCQKHFILPVVAALLAVLLLQPCALAVDNLATEPDAMVYVSDLANVLSEEVEASIDEKSAALDALTGAQLVVVTVDFLGGEAIRDYAEGVFNRLQIGDAVQNNGLLLLVATSEENYYALQGRGLETALSDTSLDKLLLKNLEPDFATGNYEVGVEKTYAGLLDALENLYGIDDQGVVVAAAEAKATQIKIENTNKQKRGLLAAVGIVLLILLPTVLITLSASRAARLRKRRREVAVRQRADY
ncbi:TPM domain-containing protein [Oscillospiraceae bacterium LTW-04]|nr:TPM domain-containing protein [Oscillospiraceae bacterium MB24-C1]